MQTFGKQQWIELFSAIGLSEDDMLGWHRLFEERYPDAHENFLRWLQLPDAEVKSIRSKSRA